VSEQAVFYVPTNTV